MSLPIASGSADMETTSLKSIHNNQITGDKGTSNTCQPSSSSVIVNFWPANKSKDQLYELFKSAGCIVSCRIICTRQSGQSHSRGYAFVNFKHLSEAEKAVSTFNGLKIGAKTLKVSIARPSRPEIRKSKLHIDKLPISMSSDELNQMFAHFGTIISSRIIRDRQTGVSLGYGFVLFDKRDEAVKAVENLNGSVPPGCLNAIAVEFSTSHGKKTPAANLQRCRYPLLGAGLPPRNTSIAVTAAATLAAATLAAATLAAAKKMF